MFSINFLVSFLVAMVLSYGAQGLKIKLNALPTIATFYPEPHFTGYPFIVNGIFDTCYNFKGHVASFSLDPDTDSCELWGVEGCGEGNFPNPPISRLAFENQSQIETILSDGSDGTIHSIRCFRKDPKDRDLK